MAIVEFVAGVFTGFVLGVGGSIFYLRWKMQKQIGNIEEQMGDIMAMSDEMSGMMEPEEMDIDTEETEEKKED